MPPSVRTHLGSLPRYAVSSTVPRRGPQGWGRRGSRLESRVRSEWTYILAWGADPGWVKAALPSVLRALCPLPRHCVSSFDPDGWEHRSHHRRGAGGGLEWPESGRFLGRPLGHIQQPRGVTQPPPLISLEGSAPRGSDVYFVISGVALCPPTPTRGAEDQEEEVRRILRTRAATWALQVRSRRGRRESSRGWRRESRPADRRAQAGGGSQGLQWGPRKACFAEACDGGLRLPSRNRTDLV